MSITGKHSNQDNPSDTAPECTPDLNFIKFKGKVPMDVTGNWRYAYADTNNDITKYVSDYFKQYMSNDY